VPLVGEPGCQGLPEPIGEPPRGAGGGQPLHHLMDHTVGQGQRTLAHVARSPHRALGLQGPPAPLGRPLQAFKGRGRAARTVLHRAAPRLECVHWPGGHADSVEEVRRPGPPLRRRLHQPGQDGMGVHCAAPRRPPAPHAFGHARDDADDELDRHALAMAERPERLEPGAAAAPAPPLPPGTAPGMAMGAELAPAPPSRERPRPDGGSNGGRGRPAGGGLASCRGVGAALRGRAHRRRRAAGGGGPPRVGAHACAWAGGVGAPPPAGTRQRGRWATPTGA
jgi:hypothetical protein